MIKGRFDQADNGWPMKADSDGEIDMKTPAAVSVKPRRLRLLTGSE